MSKSKQSPRGRRFAQACTAIIGDQPRRVVGELLGIHEATLRRWEQNGEVSSEAMEKLLSLGISPAWLLSGINEQGKDDPWLRPLSGVKGANPLLAEYCVIVGRLVALLPRLSEAPVPPASVPALEKAIRNLAATAKIIADKLPRSDGIDF